MTTTATVQRSALIVHNDQVIQNERDLPRRSCLGAEMCQECGWTLARCHCEQYAAEDAAIVEKGQ